MYYTLNPEDKYLDLRPPKPPEIPESKLPSRFEQQSSKTAEKRKVEASALNRSYHERATNVVDLQSLCYPEESSPGVVQRSTTCPLPSQSHSVWRSILHYPLRPRSSDVVNQKAMDLTPTPRAGYSEELRNLPSCPDLALLNLARSREECTANMMAASLEGIDPSATSTSTTYSSDVLETFNHSPNDSEILVSNTLPNHDTLTPRKSVSRPRRRDKSFLRISMDSTDSIDPTRSIVDLYTDEDMGLHDNNQHATSVYPSTRTSALFSPSLTSSTLHSGYMSPLHLEQPNTPMTSDFEECFLLFDQAATPYCHADIENPPVHQHMDAAYLNTGRFDGYNLPEAEHASALTLRNISPRDTKATSPVSPAAMRSSQDRVSSWNDGSAALEELFNELSYLGEVIV